MCSFYEVDNAAWRGEVKKKEKKKANSVCELVFYHEKKKPQSRRPLLSLIALLATDEVWLLNGSGFAVEMICVNYVMKMF